jgi:hypothetical protein
MMARKWRTCLLPLNTLVLVKSSHPITTNELEVTLIVKNEEYLLRAQADTCTGSIITLEACKSLPCFKNDDNNTSTWNKMGGKFTTTKTGKYSWHFNSQHLISRNKYTIL